MSKRVMLVASILLATACTTQKLECRMAHVFKVGGCNRSGVCAVEVEYGQTTVAEMPIVGHEARVCSCDGKLHPSNWWLNIDSCGGGL